MLRKKLFGACLLVVLCSLAATGSAAIYKWVDESGTVHFGDTPPTDRAAEKLETREAASGPADSAAPGSRLEAQRKRLEAIEAERQEAQKAEELAAERRAVREENCRRARSNLNTLETGGRLRYTDAEGQVRMLTDEERYQRIEEARQQVEEFCPE